jgi:hypothetical protein
VTPAKSVSNTTGASAAGVRKRTGRASETQPALLLGRPAFPLSPRLLHQPCRRLSRSWSKAASHSAIPRQELHGRRRAMRHARARRHPWCRTAEERGRRHRLLLGEREAQLAN